METIKEVIQSVADNYKDRIKNPLIGSFFISFIIYNWRSLAILLYSDWPIHCRIEWIEERYCKIENLLWPFGISIFYVLVLPYINLLFDAILNFYTKKKKSKRNNSKLEDLKQKVVEAKEEKKIADAKAGTDEINILNATIEQLKNEKTTLSEQNLENRKSTEEFKELHLSEIKELKQSITDEKNINRLVIENIKKEKTELEDDYNAITAILTHLVRLEKMDTPEITSNHIVKVITKLSQESVKYFEEIYSTDELNDEINVYGKRNLYDLLDNGLIKFISTDTIKKTLFGKITYSAIQLSKNR